MTETKILQKSCVLLLALLLIVSAACSNESSDRAPRAGLDAKDQSLAKDSLSLDGTTAVDTTETKLEDSQLAEDIASGPEPIENQADSINETAAPSFYTVAHYDLEADPAQQLEQTLSRAKAENKTVLLQVGGDWCGWCKLMTEFIAENAAVNELVSQNYLIQKVTYDSKNQNQAFLSDYPAISGYPHLFVLDATGKLLHSQNTAELEEGKGYNEAVFVAFLNTWKPSIGN